MIVSSNTTSCNWASSNVEPDSTVFLNEAPLRLAFPKLTRSRTAFVKSVPEYKTIQWFVKWANLETEIFNVYI